MNQENQDQLGIWATSNSFAGSAASPTARARWTACALLGYYNAAGLHLPWTAAAWIFTTSPTRGQFPLHVKRAVRPSNTDWRVRNFLHGIGGSLLYTIRAFNVGNAFVRGGIDDIFRQEPLCPPKKPPASPLGRGSTPSACTGDARRVAVQDNLVLPHGDHQHARQIHAAGHGGKPGFETQEWMLTYPRTWASPWCGRVRVLILGGRNAHEPRAEQGLDSGAP